MCGGVDCWEERMERGGRIRDFLHYWTFTYVGS